MSQCRGSVVKPDSGAQVNNVEMGIKVIELSSSEIRKIIAEKYGVDPSLDIVITCKRRIVNNNSVDARRVYEPIATVYISMRKAK